MSNQNTPLEHADAVLPDLSDAAVDRMEHVIFARITDERAKQQRTHRRRATTGWVTAAAAAVLVGAAAIGPNLIGQPPTAGDSYAEAPATLQFDGGAMESMDGATRDAASTPEMAMDGDNSVKTATQYTTPQVITTLQTSVEVTDITSAVESLTRFTVDAGGYVESQTVGENPAYMYETVPAPETPEISSAYMTLRIPADKVSAATAAMESVGTVTSTSTSRTDVTTQMVDLDARIDALQGSVDRLQELLSQAASVTDLLAAESALTERQAELDSLVQQQTYLSSQVEMSTVMVSLTTKSAVAANPAGFTDGLINGWNGLVATLNGMIIGLGFLLPWLAIAAVAALVIWLILRARRTPRRPHAGAGADTGTATSGADAGADTGAATSGADAGADTGAANTDTADAPPTA